MGKMRSWGEMLQAVMQASEEIGGIYLTLDEFESVRLACLEELKHVDAAKLMKISRPTFSRILTSAHKKIADALVNIKAIRIEGGCCRVGSRKNI